MKTRSGERRRNSPKLKYEKVEIRKDLQDGSKGTDLSYLNEMPQMSGYEGVKAGVPPPQEKKPEKQAKKADKKENNHLADES